MAPSKKLAMIGHVNKALLKQVKVVDQKICGAVLDPDLSSFPMELPKLTGINDHTINLIEKILKTYIEINLANGFIRLSKSQVRNSILFFPRKRRKPLVSMLIVHDWRIFGSPGPYQMLYFILLDWSAHYGKKICESNDLKTALRTRNGQLEYQTMHLPILFSGLRQSKPGREAR